MIKTTLSKSLLLSKRSQKAPTRHRSSIDLAVVQSKSSPPAGSGRAEQEHHILGGMVQCLIAHNIEKFGCIDFKSQPGDPKTDADLLETFTTHYDVETDFEYFMS